MAVAALTGLASLILEHGFQVVPPWLDLLRILDLACVILFAGFQAAKLLVVPHPAAYLRGHRLDFSLLFVLAVQTLVHIGLRGTSEFQYLHRQGAPSPLWAFYIGTLQFYLGAIVILRSTLLHKILLRLRLRPAQMLVISFLLLIMVGTLFLTFPGSSREGISLPFMDALFTATSAVCVTGLVVRDTGTHFSAVGLTILVGLIQAGGLGMLTITASFALFGGRRLEKEEGTALAQAHEVETVQQMQTALRRILITTFVLEGAGALILYRLWSQLITDPLHRTAWALFHSISAFCNAGFSLFRDNASLTRFVSDVPTNLVIGSLVVLGGLGFTVLAEMVKPVLRISGRNLSGGYSRHARWALVSTGALLVVGTVWFLLLENSGTLGPHAAPTRWLAATFQSITLRTAGFNTVDLTSLGLPTVVLCVAWMLIGGCPGGTAGGMKTTSAIAAVSPLLPRIRLDRSTWRRGLLVAGLFLGAYVVSCLLLAWVQGRWDRYVAFEAASALGTVGLSMGYTSELNTWGKLVLCLAMFVGRVGPFVLVAALLPLERETEKTKPSERVLVG